jgi:steroid delta-isomerase-like uncharacterized protein
VKTSKLEALEANKQLSRRVAEEAFSQGRMEVIDELIADDFVNHDPTSPPGLPPGREGVKELVRFYRGAFPDTQLIIDDQIAEGDKVVTRYTARGTHQGDFAGIPPTGRQVTGTGITIDRIEGGKIVESWNAFDQFALLQQLGAIPEMAGQA